MKLHVCSWFSVDTHTLVIFGGYVVLLFASRLVYVQKLSQLIYKGSYLLQQHSVQSLSRVWLFVTPWTAAHQASLSITNSQSMLKLMSIELVMPSSRLMLCHPLLLLPSIFPSITVFSKWVSSLHQVARSISISPSSEYSGLIPLGLTETARAIGL